jgi:pyruvate dehydrogenase (quinone)
MLNGAERVTLFCGRGCAGAHGSLMQLAETLKSPIVHALGGKEHVEFDNPYDVGMTGFIGFSSGYAAMHACDVLLMLGTDFPYKQFLPTGAKIAQVDIRPENLGRRCKLDLGLVGDVGATIAGAAAQAGREDPAAASRRQRRPLQTAREGLDELAKGTPGRKPIHPQYLARLVSEATADDAVFTADVGTPTIWAARYLKMNGTAAPDRLLGSRLDGQCDGARDRRPGRLAESAGRFAVWRRRLHDADGGFDHADPDEAAGESGRSSTMAFLASWRWR